MAARDHREPRLAGHAHRGRNQITQHLFRWVRYL
jgi:hypothetical protein